MNVRYYGPSRLQTRGKRDAFAAKLRLHVRSRVHKANMTETCQCVLHATAFASFVVALARKIRVHLAHLFRIDVASRSSHRHRQMHSKPGKVVRIPTPPSGSALCSGRRANGYVVKVDDGRLDGQGRKGQGAVHSVWSTDRTYLFGTPATRPNQTPR